MIFAVFDPSPLTVCINCSLFTYICKIACSHLIERAEEPIECEVMTYGSCYACL